MRARLRALRCERGMTLVELLVASTMGVVVMGAVATLVVSAVKDQPQISKQAQNVTTARWVLERLTHEIRNGVVVTRAEPGTLSLETYVRHGSCGGDGSLEGGTPAIKCQVTYTCTTTACSRTEAKPGVETGTAVQVFEGISSSQVFTYAPEPAEPSDPSHVTYVKATLQMPNPGGSNPLTVSDGASLRNATLGY
jgi:type II secretory pathway pseudopilin PulG